MREGLIVKMDYPECPQGRPNECRFQSLSGMSTLMHSPLEFDRSGKVVGGGANTLTRGVQCNACGNSFTSTATEFDDATGKPRVWEIRK